MTGNAAWWSIARPSSPDQIRGRLFETGANTAPLVGLISWTARTSSPKYEEEPPDKGPPSDERAQSDLPTAPRPKGGVSDSTANVTRTIEAQVLRSAIKSRNFQMALGFALSSVLSRRAPTALSSRSQVAMNVSLRPDLQGRHRIRSGEGIR